ncbi:hypothetical protein [Geobacter sp.]|uniref:hypothetical protein n=1 Tax=Geobacter sp. TaxID=46610 RepID=UPI0026040C3B|nr:hypothetical protein [Geobacter sp.]
MYLKSRSVLGLLVLGLFCLWLVGCGSDTAIPTTTTGTISGVAAAGAPIVGTVTIKDSNGTGIEKTERIAADGKYTIDVYGLTPPFALRADGLVGRKEFHLYSIATAADVNGNINITPFTDLVVANIAGQSAANYYDSSGFSTLTPTALNAAQTALQTKLQPILSAVGLSGSVDLLRTRFNTDHTGLDAVLDLVKVAVDPATATATITNIVNRETVTNKFAAKTYSNTFTSSGAISQAVADIQAIINQQNQYVSLFATDLPTPTDPRLLALFDSETFLDKGRELTVYLSEITAQDGMVGAAFANMVIDSIDPNAGTAMVEFMPIRKGGRIDQDNPKRFVKKNGVWLAQGDGWIVRAEISARADYNPYGSPVFKTGLYFDIWANQPGNANVFSAVVTGPGLPASGVAIDWWRFGDYGGYFHEFDNDVDIAAIPDNATYAISLYDYGNNLLATYTQTLPKRPPKFGELSAASFPKFSEKFLGALLTFTGGDMQVSWTLPEGIYSYGIEFYLYGDPISNYAYTWKTVGGSDLSTTLTIQPVTSSGTTFAPKYPRLSIYTKDIYGRWFVVIS